MYAILFFYPLFVYFRIVSYFSKHMWIYFEAVRKKIEFILLNYEFHICLYFKKMLYSAQ